MARFSTFRAFVFGAALMGLVAGCSSDETPDEPVVAQSGGASGQTPVPEMVVQRAVTAPENAKWENPEGPAPDQQAAQAAAARTPGAPQTQPAPAPANALMPRPLTPADQTAGMEQAERRYLQGESPVPGMASAMVASATSAAMPASTEARLSALEGQVSDLRKEFSSMLPAIRALIAEKDQSAKPGAFAASDPVPSTSPAPQPPEKTAMAKPAAPVVAPPASAPAAATKTPVKEEKEEKTAAPVPAAPAEVAPAAGTSGTVSDLRIGTHPDKTRIVFDVSAPISAGQDLDNEEKLFIVDLPGMMWKGPAQQTLSKDSIISSWTAQPSSDGKGSTVAFQLRGPAKILSSMQLKPDEGKGNRVVIDIAAE